MFLKSFTKQWKSSQATTHAQPAVGGGASGLQNALDKLGPQNSVSDRIAAAKTVLNSIEKYSVSSIPEIWFKSADMIDQSNSPECRRTGLMLAIECISRDQDLEVTKMSFYRSIIATSNVQDFDLDLKAMIALTKNGSEISMFFTGPNKFPKLLDNWFRVLYNSAQKIRLGSTDIASSWGAKTEDNFFLFLKFVKTVYEKNGHLFSPEDTINLISRVCKTCKKTSSVNDIFNCFEIIETIQMHSVIPIEILPDLLCVLCGTFITVKVCKEQALRIITNLVDSELEVHTFNIFLGIISNEKEARNTIRGAIRAIQIMLTRAARSDEYNFHYSMLSVMKAYAKAAEIDSLGLIFELVSCVYELLNDEACCKKFMTYEVWNSEFSSPFNVMYNISSCSTFKMLKTKNLWNEPCTPDIIGMEISDTKLKGNDKYVGMIVDSWKKIISLFCQFYEDSSFGGWKDGIISCFVDIYYFLDDHCANMVVDHFRKSQFCNPLDSSWIENLTVLVRRFFVCEHVNHKLVPIWDTAIRLKVASFTCEIYDLAKEMIDANTLQNVLSLIFSNVTNEPDLVVLSFLIDKSVEISKTSLPVIMDYLSDCFIRFFEENDIPSSNTRRLSMGSVTSSFMGISMTSSITATNRPPSVASKSINDSTLLPAIDEQKRRLIAIGFCQIFIGTFKSSAEKARSAYDKIIIIMRKTSNVDPLSFLEVTRLLIRIRATTDGYIYIANPTNMDGLSASVERNTNASNSTAIDKSSAMWWHPETVSYLQTTDLNVPSPTLKRRSQLTNNRSQSGDVEIDIRKYFDEILRIIENGAHWECYSFVWAHFGPQLSNLELFLPAGSNISRLRHTVVTQLNNPDKLPLVDFPKNVSRNGFLVALIRTISFLIPHRELFTKNDCDDIVQALSNGILGERTAVTSIHGLMVCCHEFPLSIKKYLGQIFTRFQAKITNIGTTPHILEFLLSLSRLPTLVDNFTQDEYKRVFGMAFAYLNSPLNISSHLIDSLFSEANDKASSVMSPLLNPPSVLGHPKIIMTSTNTRQISQYLLSLAYDVVATWFLTLRVEDRKFLAKYITRNLIRTGGTESVDALGMAYIDLISRFAFSDIDLTIQTKIEYPSASDSNRICRTWIYGSSIVTVDTDPQSGETYIVIRRPTGTSMFTMTPDTKMIPTWLEEDLLLRTSERGSGSKNQAALRHDPTIAMTPNYIMLQMMYPPDGATSVKPINLTNDPIVTRAIGAFDRIPVVDFHKVGILYIGPGQENEQEILSNQVGSPRYRQFLNRLGSLVRLKGNKRIYTGGLDINNNFDGEYAYIWSDKVTQMIFHTTTMMPHTNPNDTSYSSKKRHIGNDFVNIYFDESERPFQFDVIKSQFNFINIVITPVSTSFSKNAKLLLDPDISRSPNLNAQGPGFPSQLPQLGTEDRSRERTFFKVRAHCKPNVPTLFAGSHLKILSEESVADFVRNLALISSKFASIWNSDGQYKPSWQLRLEQIDTLKEKSFELATAERSKEKPTQETTETSQGSNRGHRKTGSVDKAFANGAVSDGGADISSSFLSQLQAPAASGSSGGNENNDSNDISRNNNRFTMDENDQDNFPLLNALEFTSFTE